ICEAARSLQPASLPSRETITGVWSQLKAESARQNRSVFETSSMMALSAVQSVPDGVRWLSSATLVGATRTSQIFASALLDHYKQTLSEIRETGYFTYAGRQLRPYVVAAAGQFSPKRRSLTERLLQKIQDLKR